MKLYVAHSNGKATFLAADDIEAAFDVVKGLNVQSIVCRGEITIVQKKNYDVYMENCGDQKISAIRAVRMAVGMSLADAKAVADNGGTVIRNVSKDEAEKIAAVIRNADGCETAVVCVIQGI